MKKFLVLALAMIMMVLALAACGEDTEKTPSGGTSDPSTSQQTPSDGKTNNTNTLAGHLEKYGLTENDIKPEGATVEWNELSKDIKVTVGSSQDNTAKEAFVTKIFNATKAVADGGKNLKTEMENNDYPEMSITDFTFSRFQFSWLYRYNGNQQMVNVTYNDGAYTINFVSM